MLLRNLSLRALNGLTYASNLHERELRVQMGAKGASSQKLSEMPPIPKELALLERNIIHDLIRFMEIIPTDNLLGADKVVDATIVLARQIDHAVDILRPLVYRVFAEKLWEGRFSTFGEYVQSPEGLNKSQGYGSKLKSNEKWRLDNGVSEEEISGLDNEGLYLAIKSGGTAQEVIAKARTLSRLELKQERAENDGHPFQENPNCKVCDLPKFLHP